MTIPALGVSTGQAVQDCGLGMFKIGKAQDGLGLLAIDSRARLLLHGLWPPCHQTMIRPSLGVLSGLPVIQAEFERSNSRASRLASLCPQSNHRVRLRGFLR